MIHTPVFSFFSGLGSMDATSILNQLAKRGGTPSSGRTTKEATTSDQGDLANLVYTLARLSLAHDQDLSVLMAASGIEIQLLDERSESFKKDENEAGISLRATTCAAIVLSLVELDYPAEIKAVLTKVAGLSAAHLNGALARLKPRFPTPREALPWRFQLIPSRTAAGAELLEAFIRFGKDKVFAVTPLAPSSSSSSGLAGQVRDSLVAAAKSSGKGRRKSPRRSASPSRGAKEARH